MPKRWPFLCKRPKKTQVAEPTAERKGIGNNQNYVTLEDKQVAERKTQQISASVAVLEELDDRPKVVVLENEALEGTSMSEVTSKEGTYF